MEKSDLKIGYLLECRNGQLKMLMPTTHGEILISERGDFYEKNSLKNDLTTDFSKEYDIVKVYGFTRHMTRALDFDKNYRELLWNREKKEMTVAQIEKELGYSIKIIKD